MLKNIDCGYLLEPPRRNLCFEEKYETYQNFLSENIPFLVVKFSIYLNRRVFVMAALGHVHGAARDKTNKMTRAPSEDSD